MDDADKTCTKCKIKKPLKAFYRRNTRRCGYQSVCKQCTDIQHDIWMGNDCNRMSTNARQQRYAKNNPDRFKGYELKKSHGMTLKQYYELLKQQNGLCAICGKPETAQYKKTKVKWLSVDHNHCNGKIRGLLCEKCNLILGYFEKGKRNPLDFLAYLQKYGDKNE